MKKNNVRLLSAILALLLVFQALPAGVFANEIPADEQGTAVEEVTEIIEIVELENIENDDTAVIEENNEAAAEEIAPVEEEIIEEEIVEENNEAEAEDEIIETAEEEIEEAAWQSYTLYNYISVNEGQTYISLNTQYNGISAPKTAAEFHKANGNNRYDLSTDEYEIAYYDLTSLVYTINGTSYVEKSVAKEGQPYFIARLDRVEAVAAARFRPSDCVEGIESFTTLDASRITFHRNWYLTLVTPMTSNNKLLTGIRFGDGKNGNGDGKYYGIDFTESFKAVDSRTIAFGTKLSADQYDFADYDFTDLTLTYKGVTYAYRPNGPVAGDGEAFHYYTVSLMKIDKLNKSTYSGGYLVENWPAWPLISTNGAGENGFPYKAGYFHRDYQVTLNVADAPAVIEEEPIVEEIAPVEEEPIVEEIAPVEEEPIVEEIAPVEEEPIVEEIAPVEEEPIVEEIAPVEEDPIIEEIAPVEEEPIVEEIAPVEEEPIVEEIAPVEEDPIIEEIAPVEEEPIVEEIAPVEEEPIVEEIAPVEEEPIVEEIAPVEEEPIVEEIAPVEEEPIVEEIAPVEEEPIVEEIAPVEEETVIEEIAPVEEEPIVEEIAPVEEEPIVEEIAPVEEEPIVEEIAPVEEEPIIEEIAPVEEEPIIEEIAPVEEEPIIEEIAPVEEETVIEEIAPVEEEPIVEDIAPVEEEQVVEEIAPVEEEQVIEEIAPVEEETVIEEIAADKEEIAANEDAPVAEEIVVTYSAPSANNATEVEQEPETVEETVEVTFQQAKPLVQVIEETKVPMAAPTATKAWSLINLIAMITVAFISLVMVATYFSSYEDEKENENVAENGQKKSSKLLGLLPASASIITFALTEDMNTLMVLTDKWTALMVIIVLVDLVLAYLSRNRKKEEKNNEEQYA